MTLNNRLNEIMDAARGALGMNDEQLLGIHTLTDFYGEPSYSVVAVRMGEEGGIQLYNAMESQQGLVRIMGRERKAVYEALKITHHPGTNFCQPGLCYSGPTKSELEGRV